MLLGPGYLVMKRRSTIRFGNSLITVYPGYQLQSYPFSTTYLIQCKHFRIGIRSFTFKPYAYERRSPTFNFQIEYLFKTSITDRTEHRPINLPISIVISFELVAILQALSDTLPVILILPSAAYTSGVNIAALSNANSGIVLFTFVIIAKFLMTGRGIIYADNLNNPTERYIGWIGLVIEQGKLYSGISTAYKAYGDSHEPPSTATCTPTPDATESLFNSKVFLLSYRLASLP